MQKFDFNNGRIKYDFNKLYESSDNGMTLFELYGINDIFESLNEDDEFSAVDKKEIAKIQLNASDAVEDVRKKNPGLATKAVLHLKNIFHRYGKRYFLAACIGLCMATGNCSLTLASLLERMNSNLNRPTQIEQMVDFTGGGAGDIENQAINDFIKSNYFDEGKDQKQLIKNDILQNLNHKSNLRYFYITSKCPNDDIKLENFKMVKQYTNKKNPNSDYLTIYEMNIA